MKRKIYGFIDPGMIMGVVVSLIILGVGVFAVFTVANEMNAEPYAEYTKTATNTETFETDTNESNPEDTWYTYTESGWGWANVTNETGRGTSSNSFFINDSSGGIDFSNFTFTANDFEYFQTWFMWDNTSHNFTRINYLDEDIAIVGMFDVGGTVYDNRTQTVGFSNGSISWNSSALDNNTWYQVRADFNWTTNTIRGRLFDTAGTTLNDSGYIPMGDASLTSNNLSKINFSAHTSNPAYIWFDDFTLYDTDTVQGDVPDVVGTANSVFNIIGIVLIIGAIMAIIGLVMKFQK